MLASPPVSTSTPVQGSPQLDITQQARSDTQDPKGRRERPRLYTCTVTETGSPKIQSPLRNSISVVTEDIAPSATRSPTCRGVLDFTNTKVGGAMSFTGDSRRTRPWRSESLQGADIMDTPSPVSPKPAAASSRFATFASSMFKGSPAPTHASLVAVPADDELMNLDIQAALYPSGQNDTFSPAAYKNLQQNATGLLEKFQGAYQQRTIAYYEMKAERGAQADEQEEADTKLHHLKLQLEDMARKASEQEEMMLSLMAELSHEKKLRLEQQQQQQEQKQIGSPPSLSGMSEDLQVEEDQKRCQWRRSGDVDDTDEESVEEASLFSSRSRSPTIATSINEVSIVDLTPQARTPAVQSVPLPTTLSPRKTPKAAQMNTFQKFFGGKSAEVVKTENSCQNCEGRDARVAWDTVNLLKDENKGLKGRVEELEEAVEGALDVVNGVGR
ncbi:uncharacterized protein F5Z01DRAFT_674758 [Emericellopsis atlantica]|uniref:Uncharacterized protein n=1 Tax=Emericellopsis atlantica TaxID=2614577 RepID=A0A9P7ZKN3_9HYPO|nr:uncharacterized protein F5Z01DRAFT_674758 [Emericellopsis atlantica]KAG9253879.1 hypothetical protein F5Z01DRAFT_674758 [Emericellopsis atlantica]